MGSEIVKRDQSKSDEVIKRCDEGGSEAIIQAQRVRRGQMVHIDRAVSEHLAMQFIARL